MNTWKSNSYSPHAQGWSHDKIQALKVSHIFPAPAGVIPFQFTHSSKECGISRTGERVIPSTLKTHLIKPSFPRTSGGGPMNWLVELSCVSWPLHLRGWSCFRTTYDGLSIVFLCADWFFIVHRHRPPRTVEVIPLETWDNNYGIWFFRTREA